jgi:hypothetical protein
MEYMDGAKAFVRFLVMNFIIKYLIVCPYKKCGLNMSLVPKEAYDYFSGSGILSGYTVWV